VLVRAGLKGQEDHAKDMSASIAYFTFLSVLPLTLGIVSIGSYFLATDEIQRRLVELAVQLIPSSSDLIERNIDSVVGSSGGVGLASIIVLMWSGRKMVGALSRGINNALGLERPYAVYVSTFRNLVLTVAIGVLLVFTMTLAPLVEVLAALDLEVLGNRWNSLMQGISGYAASLISMTVMLGLIYILIPYKRLAWRDLAPGLAVAVCLIEVGKVIFALYVDGLSPDNVVYGSISSVIFVFIWLYFSAWVVLYGAEVIYVYRQSREQESGGPDREPQTPQDTT
jgi:membrane protein